VRGNLAATCSESFPGCARCCAFDEQSRVEQISASRRSVEPRRGYMIAVQIGGSPPPDGAVDMAACGACGIVPEQAGTNPRFEFENSLSGAKRRGFFELLRLGESGGSTASCSWVLGSASLIPAERLNPVSGRYRLALAEPIKASRHHPRKKAAARRAQACSDITGHQFLEWRRASGICRNSPPVAAIIRIEVVRSASPCPGC
jgi:hypothetical protein